MIYVLLYSKVVSNEPGKLISGLFENAFSNMSDAEKYFKSMPLTAEYARKELWCVKSNGERKCLKEEHYSD